MVRKRRKPTEYQENGFWQSYSDMMAGVLLMFILIICGTLLVLMQVKNSYDASELALQQRQAQLEEEMSEKNAYIDLSEAQQALLDEQQAKLDEQQAKLDEQQEALLAQQALLALQQAAIKNQTDALEAQQQQLEDIIGVKKEIISELSEEFAGSNLNISIDDQTGAITFDATVLFDYDNYALSDSGQNSLAEFLPRYFAVVLSDKYIDYISEIIFEGHTDTTGDYLYNLALSQDRAEAAAAYCLDESSGLFTTEEMAYIRSLVTVSGRSWSEPVYNEDGTVNAEESRRVEIKFRLSDEEMISQMLEVLAQY